MSASASFLPYAIQCAELAARRESTRVRQHLQRRVTSLASIASTAAFIGFLGTAWGLMNSFGPVDGSRSSILGQIADGISQSMVPGLLGLFVAVLASWSYQYLRGRMEAFNLEMESTTVDFVNRLIVHLDGLKSTDPPLWAVLSRRPKRAGSVTYCQTALSENVPRLTLARGRHGLLQLIWPESTCDLDRTQVREAASWLCLAYGIFGYFAYWMQHRSLSGIVILSFFVYGGGIVRKALPREAVESVVAFFVFTLVINCLSPYGVSWVGALCCICPPLLLLGSFRAGNPARAKKEFWWLRAAGRLVLMLLLLSAATVVLFGPVLGLYTTQSYDHSMEPTIHAGDWLVGENASPTRPIVRGELVEVNSWSPRSLRVAGIPGDRIQIKNGRLIRNGVEVPDADRDRYSGSDGDFLRRLKSGRPYTVPDGFYFMLTDNLDQRDDSRTIGPIPQEYIVARVIAAYPRKPIGLELPRLIQ